MEYVSGNYVESKKMAKSSAGIAAQRISENNREIVSELEIGLPQSHWL